jgi:hypothetical protein
MIFLDATTLSLMTFSITTLSIMILSIMTLSIMILGNITFSKAIKNMTLSIVAECCNTECQYAEFCQ